MTIPDKDGAKPELRLDVPVDPFAVAIGTSDLMQRSVRGTFTTALSQIIKIFVQILSQILLARLLFPAEFGLLAMAYPVIALAQVFNDIGLGQAIVQRPTLVPEQVSTLFWVNIAISGVLAVAVALLAPLAAWMYGEPRVLLLTIALALMLPVTAISLTPNALLARHMQFGKMARNEVIAMVIGAIVTVAAALASLSYWSLVIGQLASAVTANILAWLSNSWRPGRLKLDLAAWDDIKFGANITFSNLATFATTSGDNMIVAIAAGKVPLGLYDRSYNLVVRPIGQVMAPLSRVASSLLSRLSEQSEAYRSAYFTMVRTATFLIVPGMLVCITNAPAFISVLLGPRWSAAAPIFSWICIGGLTSGIYSSTNWLFISQDRSRELKYFAAIAAVINVTSYLIGAFWGVMGIVAGAAISFVGITTPLMLVGASRRGPVRLGDIIKCCAPFVVIAVLVYCVLSLGISKLPIDRVPRLLACAFVSYGLFIGLSLVVRDNREVLLSGFYLLRAILRPTPAGLRAEKLG